MQTLQHHWFLPGAELLVFIGVKVLFFGGNHNNWTEKHQYFHIRLGFRRWEVNKRRQVYRLVAM